MVSKFPVWFTKTSLNYHVMRKGSFLLVFVFFVACASIGFLILETKQLLREQSVSYSASSDEDRTQRTFPVGVNPDKEQIIENPIVDLYFDQQFTYTPGEERQVSWFPKVLGKLALFNWYQNLASLSTRVLVVQPGERIEQVAEHFGEILGWSADDKAYFIETIVSAPPALREGILSPGTYSAARGAKPDDVIPLLTERFSSEVLERYDTDVASQVPLKDALIIASLLEREAYDFTDMRIISGIIWNRLFTDMRLQIDATLQYAKGSDPNQPWWPRIRPKDKYIASAYNTYEHEGLPPAPIANPSLDAILAALNPRKTDCFYYFHDADGNFHCAPTYEEHVALLKLHYGRGK